jgi:hypothetical protein
MTPGSEQRRAILSVNAGDQGPGRGFIVERPNSEGRLVITAAHCLPRQPDVKSIISRTYDALIGPLGEQTTVSAECLFADPVADIAVLGSPDNQELNAEAADYEKLVNSCSSFAIGTVEEEAPAWIMLLNGQWSMCKVQHVGQALWLVNAEISPGMSGSPILAGDGKVIGVVSSGLLGAGFGGPQPQLVRHLPGWMLDYVR